MNNERGVGPTPNESLTRRRFLELFAGGLIASALPVNARVARAQEVQPQEPTPEPEVAADWVEFASVSPFELIKYPQGTPGEIKVLVPDIPKEGKAVAVEAEVWYDNNQKGTAPFIRTTGGAFLKAGDKNPNIALIFYNKNDNEWKALFTFDAGPNQQQIVKGLGIWGNAEINIRFGFEDGSTFVYKKPDGSQATISLEDKEGNKKDFFSKEGPLGAGVTVTTMSHLKVNRFVVFIKDRIPSQQTQPSEG